MWTQQLSRVRLLNDNDIGRDWTILSSEFHSTHPSRSSARELWFRIFSPLLLGEEEKGNEFRRNTDHVLQDQLYSKRIYISLGPAFWNMHGKQTFSVLSSPAGVMSQSKKKEEEAYLRISTLWTTVLTLWCSTWLFDSQGIDQNLTFTTFARIPIRLAKADPRIL